MTKMKMSLAEIGSREPSQIEEAIAIALTSHRGQKDKAGNPYILHLLRVMDKMETEEEMIVAVLHDLMEDTDLSVSYLCRHHFTDPVIDALVCLTRKEDEAYHAYIERCATNALAVKVKIADLEDHLEDTTCLSNEHVQRYNDALIYLSESGW